MLGDIPSMSPHSLNSMWQGLLTAVLRGQVWAKEPTFPKLMAAANLVNKLWVEQTFMKLHRTWGLLIQWSHCLPSGWALKHMVERNYSREASPLGLMDYAVYLCTLKYVLSFLLLL
jgi:hypothetical protein